MGLGSRLCVTGFSMDVAGLFQVGAFTMFALRLVLIVDRCGYKKQQSNTHRKGDHNTDELFQSKNLLSGEPSCRGRNHRCFAVISFAAACFKAEIPLVADSYTI